MKSKETVKWYRYALLDDSEGFEEGCWFQSMLNEEATEGLARAAAEHHDLDFFWGAEDEERKLDIEVFKENGISLGVFEVHKKMIASFSIYPKNKSIDSI